MFDEPRTVIVVDDSDEIRDVLTLILEDEGYRVLPVEDGATALMMSKRIHPALITLDLGLPNEDGTQILRQLKSDPHTSTIPVLVVTGRPNVGEQERDLGADAVLLKPFELTEIQDLITKLVNCGPEPAER